jgi:MFS family permease
MGGFIGLIVGGVVSEYVGRRRTMILSCLTVLVLLPAYVLPSTMGGLIGGGFFFNFFFDGIVGLVPVHLNELSPAAYRALLPGIAYQLSGVVAAGNTVMVNSLAEKYHTTFHGKVVPAYGPVIMILTAFSVFQLAQLLAVGPENQGRRFEKEDKDVALPTKEEQFYNHSIPLTLLSYHSHTRSSFDSMKVASSEKRSFQ